MQGSDRNVRFWSAELTTIFCSSGQYFSWIHYMKKTLLVLWLCLSSSVFASVTSVPGYLVGTWKGMLSFYTEGGISGQEDVMRISKNGEVRYSCNMPIHGCLSVGQVLNDHEISFVTAVCDNTEKGRAKLVTCSPEHIQFLEKCLPGRRATFMYGDYIKMKYSIAIN